jgi:hypothetical protein
LSAHPTIELRRLREIGWIEWDPLELAGIAPADEYDEYLLQIVSRLRQGQTVEAAADYLQTVATKDMEIGHPRPGSRAAALRTAALVAKYLANVPPGPLRIR